MDSTPLLLILTKTLSMQHKYRPVSLSKPKASNLPATSLIVGDWKWDTSNTGDLVAKIYYAKRRLVWEVLDGPLKWKMEIKWSDIVAINADPERGILEIMLNQYPSFFRESDTQPRKHTNWEPSHDFTGGQALIWRIHCLVFPPKTLDKHYIQLLKCDERLLALSQIPFPRQEPPYFNIIFLQESHDLNGQGTRFPPGAQDQITYPTIGGDFAVELPQNSMVSSVINHQHSPQQRTIWNQGTVFSWGKGNLQVPQYISSVTQSNAVIPDQSYQPYAELLNNQPNDLLVGSGTLYANADSTFKRMELNSDNISASYQISYDDRGIKSASDTYSWDMEHRNAINGMTPQESVEWMTTPQVATNLPSPLDSVDEWLVYLNS